MKQQPIYISGIGSISPLGSTSIEVWESYLKESHLFSKTKSNHWIASLSKKNETIISELKKNKKKYKDLDRSVLLSILASRSAMQNAHWSNNEFGVNIGSSRGATELFEKYYNSFLKENSAKTLSSPTTTLGNISSWVAND